MTQSFDVTPSPRVLRMLGQIEFKPWQCLAELIDNSIDSFLEARSAGIAVEPRIDVSLPSLEETRISSGKIRVRDNGPGMPPDALELAVKAGYSGNDPVEKLGLFGMGFNISTARLGRRTEVWTIERDAPEWTGLTIDFDELERGRKFEVPRQSRPRSVDESEARGTEVIISKLEENRARQLIMGRGRQLTSQKLGRMYSRLISEMGLEVRLGDDLICPQLHCAWDESRRVETPAGPVAAVLPIEEDLGPRRYCSTCWVWLGENEAECPACGLTAAVTSRPRVIRGWLGIQRFFDYQHFGIDLIRNGRVIEELDKSLFYWTNPDTDEVEKEYPIDTTHWGGRIVGELEIDFVRVTHQKDAFDKHDPQWQLVVRAIRGDGPIRPHIAKNLGYPPNESSLARLFAGYRTGNIAGLRNLVPGDATGRGMNEEPKRWADRFWLGDPEYQTDEKWYEAACLAEEARKKPASKEAVEKAAGDVPFEEKGEEAEAETERAPVSDETGAAATTGPRLERDAALSGTYEIREMDGSPTMKVTTVRAEGGALPNEQPVLFTVRGNEAEFRYLLTHAYFEQSLEGPTDSLVKELAYQLLLRSHENQASWPITRVEQELRSRYFQETQSDVTALARQAAAFFDGLRDFLQERLPTLAPFELSALTERELEDLRARLLAEGDASEQRVQAIVSSGDFVKYAGLEFLVRALRVWPEQILDGEFLSVAYSTVAPDFREAALEHVAGPVRDAFWLCEQATMPGLNQQQWKEQLARAAGGLRMLELWRT